VGRRPLSLSSDEFARTPGDWQDDLKVTYRRRDE
jgi:hypothetical protein